MDKDKHLNKLFGELLEQRARYISFQRPSEEIEVSRLENEIALSLDQIVFTRNTALETLELITKHEITLATGLLTLNPRPLDYIDHLYKDRFRIKERLASLAIDKRRLRTSSVDQIHMLQRHLLDLLERHSVVTLETWRSERSQESYIH